MSKPFRAFYSEASALHDTGAGHPEHNGRMTAAIAGVERAGGLLTRLGAAVDENVDRWIVATHDRAYINEFNDAVGRGAALFQSADNPLSAGTFTASRAAVAATIAAAEKIWLTRELDRAFVIARPPGHHAERAQAMGFCFFNTIACAAERLRAIPGIDRVAVFDWDVHHGNGTQHLFEERPDVFYASIHRWPFYPGTGSAREAGRGEGRGFTLNVPMAAGDGDDDYLRAFSETIQPALDAFAPDAILISAGFDAHRRDPLGGMRVTESTFAAMTRGLQDVARAHCGGRMLSLLEGGYDMEGLRASVAEHVAAMAEA